MGHRIRRGVVVLIVFFGGLCGWAAADDAQYWNEFIFRFGPYDRLSAEVTLEQDFVDDVSRLGLINATMEPSWKVNTWFSVGPGYRYEQTKDDGEWSTEHRTWVFLGFKQGCGGWVAKFRPKMEYRDFEGDADDDWRFRAKLKVERPLQVASFKMIPFLSEEPFYDFAKDDWNQNRASAGVVLEILARTELNLYYLNMSKESDDEWIATHVIGSSLAYAF